MKCQLDTTHISGKQHAPFWKMLKPVLVLVVESACLSALKVVKASVASCWVLGILQSSCLLFGKFFSKNRMAMEWAKKLACNCSNSDRGELGQRGR